MSCLKKLFHSLTAYRSTPPWLCFAAQAGHDRHSSLLQSRDVFGPDVVQRWCRHAEETAQPAHASPAAHSVPPDVRGHWLPRDALVLRLVPKCAMLADTMALPLHICSAPCRALRDR